MKGISFEIGNEYDNYLYKIFSNVNILDYTWDISEDEILINKGHNLYSDLFTKNILLGKEFLDSILQEKYYIVSANIKAFPVGEIHSNIKSYEDFIKSSCKLILLCHDSVYVEFYCKDESILEKVKTSCEKYMFKNVEYITNENDSRTIMSVI